MIPSIPNLTRTKSETNKTAKYIKKKLKNLNNSSLSNNSSSFNLNFIMGYNNFTTYSTKLSKKKIYNLLKNAKVDIKDIYDIRDEYNC